MALFQFIKHALVFILGSMYCKPKPIVNGWIIYLWTTSQSFFIATYSRETFQKTSRILVSQFCELNTLSKPLNLWRIDHLITEIVIESHIEIQNTGDLSHAFVLASLPYKVPLNIWWPMSHKPLANLKPSQICAVVDAHLRSDCWSHRFTFGSQFSQFYIFSKPFNLWISHHDIP